MVIRLTKATRFFLACALLLLTALISIGTKSISVSTPYTFRGQPLPVVLYRSIEDGQPTGLTLRGLELDLAYLEEQGYTPLSEQELVAALRREAPLPEQPVFLLFADDTKIFASQVRPMLEGAGIAWLSLDRANLLSSELRSAGYSVMRIERTAGFTLAEQITR